MALSLANNGGVAAAGAARILPTNRLRRHPRALLPLPPRRQPRQPVSATNNKSKLSSSSSSFTTGKFDSKNRRSSPSTTTTKEQEQEEDEEESPRFENEAGGLVLDDDEDGDDGFVLPELPGEEPDFWEGPQWDALGFFVQYLWAFGVVFAVIACGIAVVTYNDGAMDFKDTPVYKESIQSQGLLEEPEGSNADVFESNPTEVAPSLE